MKYPLYKISKTQSTHSESPTLYYWQLFIQWEKSDLTKRWYNRKSEISAKRLLKKLIKQKSLEYIYGIKTEKDMIIQSNSLIESYQNKLNALHDFLKENKFKIT